MEAVAPSPLSRARARAREATRSGAALALVVAILGAGGGAMLIATELSTIVTVDVLTTGTCEEIADAEVRDACDTTGLEQHGGALFLFGALAVLMAAGAGRAGSKPAAVALIAIAGVVLAMTLLRDLPKIGETGLVGIRYEQAEATAQSGFYLEIAGAVLCALAGAIRLLRPARR